MLELHLHVVPQHDKRALPDTNDGSASVVLAQVVVVIVVVAVD